MKNYRNQNGCWNCTYKFIKTEHDEPDYYYCHVDKSKRPQCMSVLMDEYTFLLSIRSKEEYIKQINVWNAWAQNREVSPWGICDLWEGDK